MIIIKRQGDNAMDYRRVLPSIMHIQQYGDLGQMDERCSSRRSGISAADVSLLMLKNIRSDQPDAGSYGL